jgi:hypothetical protein
MRPDVKWTNLTLTLVANSISLSRLHLWENPG